MELKELVIQKNGQKSIYLYDGVRVYRGFLNDSIHKIVCEKCNKNTTTSIFSALRSKEKCGKILCRTCLSFAATKEKYGVDNIFQLESIKNKIKESIDEEHRRETCRNKTQSYWDSISEEERKKRSEASSKAKNSFSEEKKKSIEEKRKNTLIEKYGVESIGMVYKEFHKKSNRSWGMKKYVTKFGDSLSYNSEAEALFIKTCESKNIRVLNGPTIKYELYGKQHLYYPDFLILEKYIVEIKGSNHHYLEALASGEIDAKNLAAQRFSEENNKVFLYLLDYEDYNEILEKCQLEYNNITGNTDERKKDYIQGNDWF